MRDFITSMRLQFAFKLMGWAMRIMDMKLCSIYCPDHDEQGDEAEVRAVMFACTEEDLENSCRDYLEAEED